jgi:hypothetical protein
MISVSHVEFPCLPFPSSYYVLVPWNNTLRQIGNPVRNEWIPILNFDQEFITAQIRFDDNGKIQTLNVEQGVTWQEWGRIKGVSSSSDSSSLHPNPFNFHLPQIPQIPPTIPIIPPILPNKLPPKSPQNPFNLLTQLLLLQNFTPNHHGFVLSPLGTSSEILFQSPSERIHKRKVGGFVEQQIGSWLWRNGLRETFLGGKEGDGGGIEAWWKGGQLRQDDVEPRRWIGKWQEEERNRYWNSKSIGIQQPVDFWEDERSRKEVRCDRKVRVGEAVYWCR